MSRLRRLNGGSGFVPVAAEVLESRALLSGAAAAVHAATHHAAMQTQAVEPLTFHATVGGLVSINHAPWFALPHDGKFSLSNFKLVDGAKVTAKVSYSLPTFGTLTATFTGTIFTFVPGQKTFVVITPTGGNITLKQDLGGHHTTSVAVPNGTLWELGLKNGSLDSFDYLDETDMFGPTAPNGFANEPIDLEVDA